MMCWPLLLPPPLVPPLQPAAPLPSALLLLPGPHAPAPLPPDSHACMQAEKHAKAREAQLQTARRATDTMAAELRGCQEELAAAKGRLASGRDEAVMLQDQVMEQVEVAAAIMTHRIHKTQQLIQLS